MERIIQKRKTIEILPPKKRTGGGNALATKALSHRPRDAKGHVLAINVTDEMRNMVTKMARVGIKPETMAKVVGIGLNSLYKHFQDELEIASAIANTTVANALYEQAVEKKDTGAQIFWTKARMGWRQTDSHEHSGPGGAAIPISIKINFVEPKAR